MQAGNDRLVQTDDGELRVVAAVVAFSVAFSVVFLLLLLPQPPTIVATMDAHKSALMIFFFIENPPP